MTREETNAAVQKALEALAGKHGKKYRSIRGAAKFSGISVTSIYNKTTDAQLQAAREGKLELPSQPASVEQAVTKKVQRRGRPTGVKRNESAPKRSDPRYVAKLERALLKRILDKEELE